MVGKPSLEVYTSIFNITEDTINFEDYTDHVDEFSFVELEDELDEFLGVSDISPKQLQHERTRPRNIEAYQKLSPEKRETDAYIALIMGHARSPFREYESYLGILVGLFEDDIQLISKQYNSNFNGYEKSNGIYSIKCISDVFYTMGVHEGILQIKKNDTGLKKTHFNPFWWKIWYVKVYSEVFLQQSIKIGSFWDYKPTNASDSDTPSVYTSEKIINSSTLEEIHLKCDVFEGSTLNAVRQTILYSFNLNLLCINFFVCPKQNNIKDKQKCFEYYNILFTR